MLYCNGNSVHFQNNILRTRITITLSFLYQHARNRFKSIFSINIKKCQQAFLAPLPGKAEVLNHNFVSRSMI
jgi:hypothetical protein